MASFGSVISGGPHRLGVGYHSGRAFRFDRDLYACRLTPWRTQVACRSFNVAQPPFLLPKPTRRPHALAEGTGGASAGTEEQRSLVGLAYDRKSCQLPTIGQLLHLYKVNKIPKMLLGCKTPDDAIPFLKAIDSDCEAKIQVVLCIETSQIPVIAHDAMDWVKCISEYEGYISHVCLGKVHEMVYEYKYDRSLVTKAIDDIQGSIKKSIKVSTSLSVNLFGEPYSADLHPSNCMFNDDCRDVLNGIFDGLSKNSSPLFIKISPYFAIDRKKLIRISNYLLDPTVQTPYMKDLDYCYKYVFDAMVDCIWYAMDEMGFGNVDIIVETGWPNAGSKPEATLENAQIYNNNLLQHVNVPTPRRKKPIDYNIFSVMDEDKLVTIDLDLKHFGTFTLWHNDTFPTA